MKRFALILALVLLLASVSGVNLKEKKVEYDKDEGLLDVELEDGNINLKFKLKDKYETMQWMDDNGTIWEETVKVKDYSKIKKAELNGSGVLLLDDVPVYFDYEEFCLMVAGSEPLIVGGGCE